MISVNEETRIFIHKLCRAIWCIRPPSRPVAKTRHRFREMLIIMSCCSDDWNLETTEKTTRLLCNGLSTGLPGRNGRQWSRNPLGQKKLSISKRNMNEVEFLAGVN